MISLSDNETERLLRLMSLLSSSNFPAFSAFKIFAKLVYNTK